MRGGKEKIVPAERWWTIKLEEIKEGEREKEGLIGNQLVLVRMLNGRRRSVTVRRSDTHSEPLKVLTPLAVMG